VSIFIPYFDSIITSSNTRFNQNYETPFKLCWSFPSELVRLEKNEDLKILQHTENHFQINNLKINGSIWYDY